MNSNYAIEIIDHLTSTMDHTHSRLDGTTRNIGDVLEQESTKMYWLVIFILLVCNVIVAIV